MRIDAKSVRRCVLIIMLGLMCTNLVDARPVSAQTSSNDVAATRALALVNQWRIEQGLAPLIINPTLQRMAEAQAIYIAPKADSIEDEADYHKDAQGRTAIQRAIQVYNWPNYGQKDQIEVGENAAHFPADRAVDFWKSSPPHMKAALSTTYREVGIAAIPQKPKGSFVFYMTFGARPLTLTALIDPATDTIYLTKEQSRYFLRSQKTEPKVTVRFYTEGRVPVTEELPWKVSMPLPPDLGDKFYVRYSGYKDPIWVEVSRSRNIAILPNGKMTVSAELTAVSAAGSQTPGNDVVVAQPTVTTASISASAIPTLVAAVNTPTRTRIAIATNTPRVTASPSRTATRRSAIATNTVVAVVPSSTATMTVTATKPAPTATITATAGQADLTITYNARALFITNTSGKPVSIDGLQVGRLTLQNWLRIVSFNTQRFPNGYCLQANLSSATNESAPGNCRNVQAQINISTSTAFWAQADFEIKLNDTVIQRCVGGAGRCEVDLP
ncbi:MAG: hypothetical protein KF716_29090 [Anaerolineae bacterium]|nr:hypothetical protein [Anaerolineae bacterium]